MSTKGRHLPDGPPCSAVLNLINSWKWRRRPSTPQNPATPLCVLRSHPPPLSTSQNDVKFNRARPSVPRSAKSVRPRLRVAALDASHANAVTQFIRAHTKPGTDANAERGRQRWTNTEIRYKAGPRLRDLAYWLWPRGRVHATYGPPYSGALINLNKTSD